MSLHATIKVDIDAIRARGNQLNAQTDNGGARFIRKASVMDQLLTAVTDPDFPKKHVPAILQALAFMTVVE